MAEAGVEIYGLCEPSGDLRYIGKAVDARRRFAAHLRETRRRTPVYDWIASLRERGQTPRLVLLERCAEADWPERERLAIKVCRAAGMRLLNVADGGDQPHCPPAILAANGPKSVAAREATPDKRRIWELKRNIGESLKRGHVSERAKAKLRIAARIAPHLFGEYAKI